MIHDLIIGKEPEEIVSDEEQDQQESTTSATNEGWYTPVGARYRSETWKYFKLNGDKTKTKCQLCPSILVYPRGTTTMAKHLFHIHDMKLESKSKNNCQFKI